MPLRSFATVPQNPREWEIWCKAQFITADTVAPNTITTGMIVDAQVTFAKIQDLNALSVLGRPVNSAGVGSSIAASSDLTLLRRSGLAIGFGTITSAYVSDFNEAAQDAVSAALTDTASVDFSYNDGANTISAVVLPAGVDHSALANLTTGDPHTQYPLAAGTETIGGAWTFSLDVTFSDQIICKAGTTADVSVAGPGDPNTGLIFPSADAMGVGAGGTESARFDASATAGNTRFMLYDVDNATLERVSVGAADSGGAGFKLLRIPN